MTTPNPTPGDELVERIKTAILHADPANSVWRGQLFDIILESLRRDEAARSSTTEVEELREALNDAVVTLAAVRAQTGTGTMDAEECRHFYDLCGETLLRARPALQAKDHSHVG